MPLTGAQAEAETADVLIAQAHSAERLRDWDVARGRWSSVKSRFPELWSGYRGEAMARQELRLLADAEAVLQAAAARFPNNPDIWHDRGRLAERRQDWVAAESNWRAILAHDSTQQHIHGALVFSLQ